jgi:hypothetical protein
LPISSNSARDGRVYTHENTNKDIIGMHLENWSLPLFITLRLKI